MPSCAVPTCNNYSRNTKGSGVIYHRFPKNEIKLKEWIIKCRRANNVNLTHVRVCSNHFAEEDYERDLKAELLGLPPSKKLKPDAVPSLKLSYFSGKAVSPYSNSLGSTKDCSQNSKNPIAVHRTKNFKLDVVSPLKIVQVTGSTMFTYNNDHGKTEKCLQDLKSELSGIPPVKKFKPNVEPSLKVSVNSNAVYSCIDDNDSTKDCFQDFKNPPVIHKSEPPSFKMKHVIDSAIFSCNDHGKAEQCVQNLKSEVRKTEKILGISNSTKLKPNNASSLKLSSFPSSLVNPCIDDNSKEDCFQELKNQLLDQSKMLKLDAAPSLKLVHVTCSTTSSCNKAEEWLQDLKSELSGTPSPKKLKSNVPPLYNVSSCSDDDTADDYLQNLKLNSLGSPTFKKWKSDILPSLKSVSLSNSDSELKKNWNPEELDKTTNSVNYNGVEEPDKKINFVKKDVTEGFYESKEPVKNCSSKYLEVRKGLMINEGSQKERIRKLTLEKLESLSRKGVTSDVGIMTDLPDIECAQMKQCEKKVKWLWNRYSKMQSDIKQLQAKNKQLKQKNFKIRKDLKEYKHKYPIEVKKEYAEAVKKIQSNG